MEVCPKCNQLMTWYMTYNCGTPYCGYHCYRCGYDTKDISYTNTASTIAQTINEEERSNDWKGSSV